MKAQNRKVMQAVMKSPSPDIAHRSIIAHTKSPVNQIKEYIKIRQSSASPKSMTTSFHQIAKSFSSQNQEISKLKKYILELEYKLNFLQKIQNSHNHLTLINQDLMGQLAQLKAQLRHQRQRSHSNASRNISPNNVNPISPKNGGKGVSLVKNTILHANPQIQNAPQPTQNDNILRQFNERMIKMAEQNKRLSKKLHQTQSEKDQLENQVSILRIKNATQSLPHFASSHQTDSLKRQFSQEADRIAAIHKKANDHQLSKLKAKLNEVESELHKATQKLNQKKIYTRTNTPNELKANISMDTNFRSENQEDGPSALPANRYNMVESKYTTSPSQFKAFTLDTSPIRVMEEEKQRLKRQNDFFTKKSFELEKQLRNALMANNDLELKLRKIQALNSAETQEKKHLSDSNFSLYKSTKEINEQLEAQLANKNAQIKHNDAKINELEQNLRKMEDMYSAIGKDYEKSMDQQRQKNNKLMVDNQHYQSQISFYQQNYISKDRYLILERQIHEIKETYSRYRADFERYLKMVYQIRSSITGEDVDQCLQDIEGRWEGYDELELEITKIYECYQALVENLKRKLLEKDQRIGQLQRQNNLLSLANQQTKHELSKLQRAIKEYQEPVRNIMTESQLKQRMAIHQSGAKSKEKCRIREYINRTASDISSLQNQISRTINTSHFETKMVSSISYSRQPVGPDNFYRGDEGSVKQQFRRQNVEYRQDVADEETHMPHQ